MHFWVLFEKFNESFIISKPTITCYKIQNQVSWTRKPLQLCKIQDLRIKNYSYVCPICPCLHYVKFVIFKSPNVPLIDFFSTVQSTEHATWQLGVLQRSNQIFIVCFKIKWAIILERNPIIKACGNVFHKDSFSRDSVYSMRRFSTIISIIYPRSSKCFLKVLNFVFSSCDEVWGYCVVSVSLDKLVFCMLNSCIEKMFWNHHTYIRKIPTYLAWQRLVDFWKSFRNHFIFIILIIILVVCCGTFTHSVYLTDHFANYTTRYMPMNNELQRDIINN